MFYELGQLAVGNLARARGRLVMTAGGVLVGTAAVILLIAMTIGLQRAAESGLGQSGSLTELQVYPNWNFGPGSDSNRRIPQLDVAAVRALWRVPGVAAVVPVKNLQSGQIVSGDYFGYAQVMGIAPELLPYLGIEVQSGELRIGRSEVLVGPLVSQFFYDPEADPEEEQEPIVVDLETAELTLEIFSSDGSGSRDFSLTTNGILVQQNGMYDGALIMPLDQVIELGEWSTGERTDWETFTFDQIIVRTSSREVTTSVTEAINDLGYQAFGLGAFLNELNNFFGTMRLMLGGVGGVALLVAAFGVANTMTMAILERTKEIGLMKAIGATDRDILTIFLVEAGLVGAVGGLSGIGLAYLLQGAINQAIRNLPTNQQGGGFMFLPVDPATLNGELVVIPTELAVFAVVLATCVGLGAGLFPALRAARLQPVVALKSE